MSNEELDLSDNCTYIGAGVTVKGEISAPDLVIIEGAVEGDVSGRIVRVGINGSIRGSVAANEADIQGFLSENVEITGLLNLRATGRVEGTISCGDLQVERGAGIAGAFAVNNPSPAASTEALAEAVMAEPEQLAEAEQPAMAESEPPVRAVASPPIVKLKPQTIGIRPAAKVPANGTAPAIKG
jgi:cytoskeletal protein CcmA (bactofilin family)